MTDTTFATADLCDAHENSVRVLALPWLDLGGRTAFHGQVSTIKACEDNSRVREAVAEPGKGLELLTLNLRSIAFPAVVHERSASRVEMFGDDRATAKAAVAW